MSTLTNAVDMNRELRSLASPRLLEAIRATRESRREILSTAAKASALGADTGFNERAREMMLLAVGKPPAVSAFIEQNSKVREQMMQATGEPPALEALTGRKWQEAMQAAGGASIFKSWGAQHQEKLHEVLVAVGGSPGLERAFDRWSTVFPPALTDQLAAFQGRLIAVMDAVAPAEFVDEEEGAVWFGAESWSRLHFEMVTLLKCAELMTAGMTAAKGAVNAPVPPAVLCLLYLFIAAGELAAHLARGSLQSLEE